MLTGFAVVGVVLTVSALASGVVERAPLSFPMIFLGLGFLLGERGVGFVAVAPTSESLRAIAILNLSLVLFLDAVKLRAGESRHEWVVPVLTLGPGTLLIIGFIAVAAAFILGLPPVQALMLGAVLASTDPVVLRDILRDTRIPASIRRALGIEAGLNDIVVLPILLVLIAVARAELGSGRDWLVFLGQLLVLGPLAGFAVGGAGSWLMQEIDRRMHIRREHQSLYGVGLVLASYVAGEAVGGDGFLAAFAAGLAIVVLNTELCNCFLEFGEVIAEMAMLVAFVLFGALLSTLLPGTELWPSLALAVLAIGVGRPLAIGLVLQRARASRSARAFIAWFGPRGLNSLLFALLLVEAGVPGAERLFVVAGVVVIVSVVAHGMSATPLAAWYGRRVAAETLPEERESTAAGLFQHDTAGVPRITPIALAERLAGPDPPLVIDARSRSGFAADPARLPGSVRVAPDQIADWAAAQTAPRPVVVYCSCPEEETSARVARRLKLLGFEAAALKGGLAAWRAQYPVEAVAATG